VVTAELASRLVRDVIDSQVSHI